MADLIRIKGGNGAVPTLKDREIAYSKDEQALYIGTEGGNVRLCGVGDTLNVNDLVEKISEIEGILDDITIRLEAIETPSE